MSRAEATTAICGTDGCATEIVLDEARSIEEGVSNGRYGFATVELLVCDPCYEAHHAKLTGARP